MRHKSWAPIVDYIREAEAVRSGRRAAGVDTSFVARNDASISTEQLIVPVHSIFGSANNGLEAGSIMTSAWPSRQHHLLRRLRGYISQWTTNPRDGTQFPDHAAAPAQIARTLWVRLMTSPG